MPIRLLQLLAFCLALAIEPALAQQPDELGDSLVPPDAAAYHQSPVPSTWWESIRESLGTVEYAFTHDEQQRWLAVNRPHAMRARIGERGIEAESRTTNANGDAPAWHVAIGTRRFGRLGDTKMLAPTAPLSSAGERVVIHHGALDEFFVNDERGIEQGWQISSPPPGRGNGALMSEIVIELEINGDLGLRLGGDGRSGELVDAHGQIQARYHGLAAWDAAGRALDVRLVATPAGVAVHLDDDGAVYPVTIDPILSGPMWTGESNQANAWFGCSVATAGDVNGDGFSDVIVGALYYENGEPLEGRAFVYHGSGSGLESTPRWTVEGNQFFALLGHAVSTAGDVNGDGYSDVIVSAHTFDNDQSDEGRAYVYLGAKTGLQTTAIWMDESDQDAGGFGYSVAAAGDIDGDGLGDIVVGAVSAGHGQLHEGLAFAYRGPLTGPDADPFWMGESNQASSEYGVCVATAGDVNADGHSDVIVGARLFDNGQDGEGRAYLYLGSPSGLGTDPAWTAESNQQYASFAVAVSTAGDVNGDGYCDAIVGAMTFANSEQGEGGAFVYLGTATGLSPNPVWSAESNQVNAWLGYSVSTAGDVNGDGFSDVAVGTVFFTSPDDREGRASVYLGSASGPRSAPSWTVEGNQVNAELGYRVACAGDVNGDGYSDVIVGAPLFDRGELDEGIALVYHGGAVSLSRIAAWSYASNQKDALLGPVTSAGDVNGDGYSDVLVAAPSFDHGETNEGTAFLFLGWKNGMGLTPSWTGESNLANGGFGAGVASAGDVNGDGLSDVIIGSLRGRAYVYLGAYGGLSANPWLAQGTDGVAWRSVAGAGDVNGDGFCDVIVGAPAESNGQTYEGRVFVWHGGASGLGANGTPANADWSGEADLANAQFGRVVASAGDVNADGFSDILVLETLPLGLTYANVSSALAWFGGATGLGPSGRPANADWWRYLTNAGSASLAGAGDVNADGLSDVAVGLPGLRAATVFAGSVNGIAGMPIWSYAVGYAFGQSVASAGDVNGDGFGDLVVGDPYPDWSGYALCFHGTASGLTGPGWTVGGSYHSGFGSSVAGAGDVNGDGFSDVVVGAPNFVTNAGVAVLYLGNEGDGLDRSPRQARANDTPVALLGNADPTTFRLRTRGRTPAGRGKVALEFEARAIRTPFDGLALGRGLFVDSGPPVVGTGSAIELSELVLGLAPATPYHWRLRIVSKDLFVPRSPWLTLPGNNRTETKIRTN